MERRPISVVTFDAGNTLLYCEPSPKHVYAEAMSRHGREVHSEEVGPVFRDAWAEMQRRTPPGKDRYSSVRGGDRAWWGAFVREVLDRLDHDAPWEHLLDELYAAFARPDLWRVFPEVDETIAALSSRGLRLAVISNWDRRLPEILEHLGLDRHFEAVTVSAVEGVEKPAPEIFERTLERLGVTAATTMHVGDSLIEDYRGAEAAGLEAVLVDRRGLFNGESVRRVASLDGVLAYLDEAP